MVNIKLKKKRSRPVWLNAQEPLRQWYSTSLGQSIAECLETELERRLCNVFGYQGLQIGNLVPGMKLLAGAGLQRNFVLDAPLVNSGTLESDRETELRSDACAVAHTDQLTHSQSTDSQPTDSQKSAVQAGVQTDVNNNNAASLLADMHADVLSLPVASGTMKAVAFFHTLDFCDHPHQALREANRVLTDDGELIIVGFNPYSAFGARHSLTAWRRREPWNGCFYARHRVSDWLSVLDYRVLGSNAMFMRPPLNSERAMRRLSKLEDLHRWLGGMGGVYVMHARKQTIPMSTVRQRTLRTRKPLAAGSFARTSEPATAKARATVARIGPRMLPPNSQTQ